MSTQSNQSQVVLISLDGGTYSLLKNYLDTNQIDPTKGLGLLKSKGVFLPNTTVTPSLTAPGHIAIATGSTAANNDINSNTFHLVGSPFSSNISGFGAPIGGYDALNPDGPRESSNPTAEPLWINLLADAKKVVAATFPGADGIDVKVPGLTNSPIIQSKTDRTVSYTIPFGAFGGLSAKGFNLTANNFNLDPTQAIGGLNALGIKNYSPVKVAGLEAIPGSSLTGGSSATSYNLQVAAIDTSNDNLTNYDTLVFFDANRGVVGKSSLPSTGSAFVKASDKKSSQFYFEGSNNKVGTAFYATTLASDLSTVNILRYSANYIPRPAESPGVITNADDINNNVGFWANQPDFRIPERLDSSFKNFSDVELEAAVLDQVNTFVDYQAKVLTRSIQQNPNADLVLGYIEQPDGSQHQFLLTDPRQATDPTNPNTIYSGQDQTKIQRYKDYTLAAYNAANNAVQKVIDTVGVDANGVPNKDILVVSDHGFAPFHTAVNINNLLANSNDADLKDPNKVRAISSGPAVNIYINVKGREPNGTVDPANYPAIQQKIVQLLQNFKDSNPNYAPAGAAAVFDKVYSRPVGANPTAADIIKATSAFIGQDSGDVFALMSLGYNFDGTQSPAVKRLGDDPNSSTPVLSVPNFYGAHGYDPTLPQMQAIFLGAGPDIDRNAITQKSINNIDIAPTVEKILGVQPAPTVQGQALQGIKSPLPKVNFIGQATYPAQSLTVKDAAGADTLVGGLSGITYDAKSNLFYVQSDDRKTNFGYYSEPGQPPRYYTLNIDLSSGRLDNSKVAFTGVTYLKKADGSFYAPQTTDTEDIGVTNKGTVFVSSEGQVDAAGQIRVNPFINEYRLLDGQLVRTLPIPTKFLPDASLAANQTRGTYDNLAFESVAVSPDQKTLFTGSENALVQDGQRTSYPGSDPKNPSGVGRSRLLKFNLDTNQATGEYLYNISPTAVAPSKRPDGSDNFVTTGLVALTALDNNGTMLAIERSFSSTAANTPLTPETGNTIKLYRISVGDATDLSGINSLNALSAADLEKIKPVKKELLLNFNDLKLPTGLDNIEGVTFGPTVNGKPTLLVVADDNFRKTPNPDTATNTANNSIDQPQFSQILAFTVDFSGVFANGVASGDATADSAVVWTRTFDAAANQGVSTNLSLQLSTDPNFTKVAASYSGVTDPSHDYTLKIDAKGLQSGTNYYYRFVTPAGDASPTGTFKTAIDSKVAAPVRFAFSGDADGQWRPYASTANFNKLGLDYFVFLGDTIYETASKGSLATANPVTNPAQALNDYRRKYAENLQPVNNGGVPGLQGLYASQGNYTLLDNHELGNNQIINGGAPSPMATVSGNGSSNSADDVNKTGSFINKTQAFKTLEQAYSEYQPIREKTISAPNDPRTDGTQQLYYSQQWGKNSIFVNVDDRSYRDVRLKKADGVTDDTGSRADNPDRTMLGATQLAWLKQTLLDAEKSGTPWKFVALSSPIDQIGAIGSGADGGKSWIGGYRAERNNLLKFIADNNIKNVVFLSTDDHQNRINEITYLDNVNDPNSLKVLPYAFSIVDGPLGAGGPDVNTDHSFTALKKLADDLVQKQKDAGVNPIGLDRTFPGLKNVVREGDANANSLRQPVDFYSPDTFNYSVLDVSADGKTLSVNVQGINSFAANTFPEPSATNPVRSILSFSVDAAPAFPNGVASGDTTQTSTVLWARTNNLGTVKFDYSTKADFSTIAGTLSATETNVLQPVKVNVSGLTAGTDYFYRATDATGATATGKFSTAAAIGTRTGLTFGVSGDWRGELAPYPAISNAAKENLKFFLEFGDTIYGDVASPGLKNANGTEKQQAITLDDYRAKYAEVYGSRYGQNTFADLRASTSILATLDDHEVTNDFAGGAPISSDKGGVGGANRFLAAFPNDNPNAQLNNSTLYENGTKVFQEYKPVQDQFYGQTGDVKTAGERKIYRYNTFGKDAATFVLDARSFRDTELSDVTDLANQTQVGTFLAKSFDPTRTLLGRQQLQDLKNDLLNAQSNGTTWKFVMIPEPIENLGVLAAGDRFEGYAAERTEILKFINENKINNVVFVSADIHGTLVNNLTYQNGVGQPQIATSAFEVVTGPVAYDAPFGPTVADLALSTGLITTPQKALYDSLPNAGKDAFIKGIVNSGLTPLGYDPVGLDNNLSQANGLIRAKLLKGDYVATNTYGWTEFNINPTTQKLTVTTWGTDAYTRAQLEANSTAIAALQPQVVSQFEVEANPIFDAPKPVTTGVSPNDDVLIATPGAAFDGKSNVVFTGAGNDKVDLAANPSFGVGTNYIDLGSGNDTIFVSQSDRVFGRGGDDILDATRGKGLNRLSGGAGNDTFNLGSGDTALGGAGNDKFFAKGGGGNTITGGAGADQFWIAANAIPTTPNTITDFQVGIDTIGILGGASLGISSATLSLNQLGANTAIGFGNQTLAILTGIQASSLSLSNLNQFVFN